MRFSKPLLALAIGLSIPTFSAASPRVARSTPDCELLVSQLGADEKIARVVGRYWDDEFVDSIAREADLLWIFNHYKYPFAIDLRGVQNNNVLEVDVTLLSTPELTERYFGAVTLMKTWRTSRTFDATLAKAMAGVLKGALLQISRDSLIDTVVIRARGVNNSKLARMLEKRGFTGTAHWYSRTRGKLVFFPHKNLEITLRMRR